MTATPPAPAEPGLAVPVAAAPMAAASTRAVVGPREAGSIALKRWRSSSTMTVAGGPIDVIAQASTDNFRVRAVETIETVPTPVVWGVRAVCSWVWRTEVVPGDPERWSTCGSSPATVARLPGRVTVGRSVRGRVSAGSSVGGSVTVGNSTGGNVTVGRLSMGTATWTGGTEIWAGGRLTPISGVTTLGPRPPTGRPPTSMAGTVSAGSTPGRFRTASPTFASTGRATFVSLGVVLRLAVVTFRTADLLILLGPLLILVVAASTRLAGRALAMAFRATRTVGVFLATLDTRVDLFATVRTTLATRWVRTGATFLVTCLTGVALALILALGADDWATTFVFTLAGGLVSFPTDVPRGAGLVSACAAVAVKASPTTAPAVVTKILSNHWATLAQATPAGSPLRRLSLAPRRGASI